MTAVNAVRHARDKSRNGRNRERKPKVPKDDGDRPKRSRHRKDGQRKGSDQDDVVCYHCHEPGHIRPDCPKRRSAKRAGSRANVTTEDSSSEEETVLAVSDQVNALSNETDCWYLDSGATRHVTCRRDLLHNYVEREDRSRGLLLGNNHRCPVLGHGTLKANATVDGKTRRIVLHRVLYAPELAKNLVSTALIARNGHQIRINARGCRVSTADGETILRAHLSGNMLQLPIEPIPPPPDQALAVKESLVDVNKLHRRLGHAREKRLRAVLKQQGLKWPTSGLADCVVCQKAKTTRKPIHKTPMPRAARPMERVHSDVCGPMSVNSRDGKRYFVSFVDDHSRYAVVYAIRAKSEVKDALQHFLRSAPNGYQCRFLHTDQGGEYKNDAVAKLLLKHGVTHETTSSHTPEHNGVAERFNRTILEMLRCMLLDSGLPKNLWNEALTTAVAINNRLPTSANNDTAPIVKWDASLNQSIEHLHHFGAAVQVLLPDDERTKLGPRTRDGIYLGPARENATHHRILVKGRVIETRDVAFSRDPGTLPSASELIHRSSNDSGPAASTGDPINLLPDTVSKSARVDDVSPPASPPSTPTVTPPATPPGPPIDISTTANSAPQGRAEPDPPEYAAAPPDHAATTPAHTELQEIALGPDEDGEDSEPAPRPSLKRPRPWPSPKKPPARNRRPNKRVYNRDFRVFVTKELKSAPVHTPGSYREAINSPEAAHWIRAMTEEFNALTRNSTFVLVSLPKDRKAIGARWLFKLKRKADGSIDRYKARWVAKGYSQKPGVDYDETFAPVIRLENLRLLLAIAAALNLEVHQMDVDNAFLNADLTEEIYIDQPEGFEDSSHPDFVCRLRKSLYGLKQAPLEWNRTIDAYLKNHGFKPTKLDPCIYVHHDNGQTAFIAVYVDDCTIIAPHDRIADIKSLLHQGFRMKDLGMATSVLGLEVMRDPVNGATYIRQAGKIHEIVHDFGLADAKPVSTHATALLSSLLLIPIVFVVVIICIIGVSRKRVADVPVDTRPPRRSDLPKWRADHLVTISIFFHHLLLTNYDAARTDDHVVIIALGDSRSDGALREMRKQNEHLHKTMVYMRAWQEKTDARLASTEAESQAKVRNLEQAYSDIRHQLHDVTSHLQHFGTSTRTAALSPPFSSPHSPPFVSTSSTYSTSAGSMLPLVNSAAVASRDRSEFEEVIDVTLPFLRRYNSSSFVVKDRRQLWLLQRHKGAETLDEMETPVIFFASPALCHLLGYDAHELVGCLVSKVTVPDFESLISVVSVGLARPRTPVSSPVSVQVFMATKQGRRLQATAMYQPLFNEKRLASWSFVLVQQVFDSGLTLSTPLYDPDLTSDALTRKHLMAHLPHLLLFGRQGNVDGAILPHRHHQYQPHQHYQHQQHSRPGGTTEATTTTTMVHSSLLSSKHPNKNINMSDNEDYSRRGDDEREMDQLAQTLGDGDGWPSPTVSQRMMMMQHRVHHHHHHAQPSCSLAERWMYT